MTSLPQVSPALIVWEGRRGEGGHHVGHHGAGDAVADPLDHERDVAGGEQAGGLHRLADLAVPQHVDVRGALHYLVGRVEGGAVPDERQAHPLAQLDRGLDVPLVDAVLEASGDTVGG